MFRSSSHRGSMRRYKSAGHGCQNLKEDAESTGIQTKEHHRHVSDSEATNLSLNYPNPIPFRRQSVPARLCQFTTEPAAEIWVTNIDILGIKVFPNKRFMYVLQVQWSQGETTQVVREYEDFFKYHCWLLDTFHEEAGLTDSRHRVIPFLPGKKIFRKNSLTLAEERQPLLASYLKELVKLSAVKRDVKAQAFFCWRPGDPRPDHDPVIFAVNQHGKNGKLQSIKVEILAGFHQMEESIEKHTLLNKSEDMDGCHSNSSFTG